MKNAIIVFAIALAGCTDARWAKVGGYGDPARVTCYSGGVRVFDDFSTGKVSSEGDSDGYYFKSASTGKLIEMSGDCRLIYNASRPTNFRPVM